MRISPASSAAHQCSTILSFRHPHPYHPSPHNPQFYLHLDFLRLPTTHFLKKKGYRQLVRYVVIPLAILVTENLIIIVCHGRCLTGLYNR